PAYVARRWRIVVALGPETIDRRPRLNQRAVHREMLIADQVLFARELDDAAEKLARHVMLQQPLLIMRKRAVIKRRLVDVHINEPAKQKVVFKLFAKQALAAHRVEGEEKQAF